MEYPKFCSAVQHEMSIFFMKYGSHVTEKRVYMGYEDKRKLQQSVPPGSFTLYPDNVLMIYGFEIIEVNRVHHFEIVIK